MYILEIALARDTSLFIHRALYQIKSAKTNFALPCKDTRNLYPGCFTQFCFSCLII